MIEKRLYRLFNIHALVYTKKYVVLWANSKCADESKRSFLFTCDVKGCTFLTFLIERQHIHITGIRLRIKECHVWEVTSVFSLIKENVIQFASMREIRLTQNNKYSSIQLVIKCYQTFFGGLVTVVYLSALTSDNSILVKSYLL